MAPDAADAVVILPYDDEAAVERIVAPTPATWRASCSTPRPGSCRSGRSSSAPSRRPREGTASSSCATRSSVSASAPAASREQFGIRPDLSTYGKIVGGGLPVGAFGGRRDIMDLTDNSAGPARVFQSGTHSGHALAMAAGRATLEQLTPEAFATSTG